jgi:hypothetical protein
MCWCLETSSAPEPFLELIAPYREDVAMAAECMFTWYWLGAPWAPDVERTVAPKADEPARQPEIRKPDDVIRVQVREKDAVHVLPADSELGEALQSPSACVE